MRHLSLHPAHRHVMHSRNPRDPLHARNVRNTAGYATALRVCHAVGIDLRVGAWRHTHCIRAPRARKITLLWKMHNHVHLSVRLGAERFVADITLVRLGLKMDQLVMTLQIAFPTESCPCWTMRADKDLGCLGFPAGCRRLVDRCRAPSKWTRAVSRVTDRHMPTQILRIGQGRRALATLERLRALRVVASVRPRGVAGQRLFVAKCVMTDWANV
jgi:hypothetical protein